MDMTQCLLKNLSFCSLIFEQQIDFSLESVKNFYKLDNKNSHAEILHSTWLFLFMPVYCSTSFPICAATSSGMQ